MTTAHDTTIELQNTITDLQRHLEYMERANAELQNALTKTSAELEQKRKEIERHSLEHHHHIDLSNDSSRLAISLLRNIPGVLYRCANDAAWTMEYISNEIESLSGYPAEDFVDNSVRTYSSIIHPGDSYHVLRAVNEGVTAKRPYEIAYRIHHADGSVRNVYERGRGIFTRDGNLLWLDGVILHDGRSRRADSEID